VFSAVASVIKNAGRMIQLVVVGDFYQLPPVLMPKESEFFCGLWHSILSKEYNIDDMGEPYPFLTQVWNDFEFHYIELTEQMRQKNDIPFLEALNRVRVGDTTALPWIESHSAQKPNENAIVNVINLFTMQKSTVKQVSHSARRKSRTTRQGQPLILAVPTNNGYAFSRAS
jgi:hypothetical protein